MCDFCDGAAMDEVRFNLHGSIAREGWSLVAVEAREDRPPWTYTIGLMAGFDHPELVVVGLEKAAAAGLLNAMGKHIREGERFRPGEGIRRADGSKALLLDVDPVHFSRNVFALWLDYYACLGPPFPSPEAVQVWFPRLSPVRLDEPADALRRGGAGGPIRAETRWRPRR